MPSHGTSEDSIRVIAIRLPPYVYGRSGSYFAPLLMQMAAKAGQSIYVDDGHLRTSDVHVDDAATLFLLYAAKKAKPGDIFNGTGSTTVTLRQLAEAIGAALQVPVRSVSRQEAEEKWGSFLTAFVPAPMKTAHRIAKPFNNSPGILMESVCSRTSDRDRIERSRKNCDRPEYRESEPGCRLAHMPTANAPLTRDQILGAAEDVIRKFGPAKATVVDVARALGVSHAAVYRHVATKAELRDLVVRRWVDETMPPRRAMPSPPNQARPPSGYGGSSTP